MFGSKANETAPIVKCYICGDLLFEADAIMRYGRSQDPMALWWRTRTLHGKCIAAHAEEYGHREGDCPELDKLRKEVE